MSKQDYYETLEVAKGATVEEIKKSYRRLAMKYHPDRNQGNAEAEAKFKEINEAYEILKDDQKRAAYDRYGHAAFEQGGGANPFDFNFGSGFGDIFSEVFSDFMGGGRRSNRASAGSDGEDLRYDLEISLEDAFNGLEKEISFPTEKVCDKCSGFGTKDGKEPPVCPTCRGSGRVHRQHGFMIMETVCPDCGGRGRKAKDACPECKGAGTVPYTKELKIKVPAGIDDGTRIRLAGEGMPGVGSGTNIISQNARNEPQKLFAERFRLAKRRSGAEAQKPCEQVLRIRESETEVQSAVLPHGKTFAAEFLA